MQRYSVSSSVQNNGKIEIVSFVGTDRLHRVVRLPRLLFFFPPPFFFSFKLMVLFQEKNEKFSQSDRPSRLETSYFLLHKITLKSTFGIVQCQAFKV